MIVTHEIQFAKDVADKTAIIADGIVVEFDGTKKAFSKPSDPRTRAFLARHLEKQVGETDAATPPIHSLIGDNRSQAMA